MAYLEAGRPAGACYIYMNAENSGYYQEITISTEYEVLSAIGTKPDDIYKIINDRLNPNGNNNVTFLYGKKVIAGDKSIRGT